MECTRQHVTEGTVGGTDRRRFRLLELLPIHFTFTLSFIIYRAVCTCVKYETASPILIFQPWFQPWPSNEAIYRVIFDNLHQELTFYRLVLSLLRFLKASMWPQDWAQITFRSEILSNQFKNKSGRCVLKGGISWSSVLRRKYWVVQNSFLLPVLNFENHRL